MPRPSVLVAEGDGVHKGSGRTAVATELVTFSLSCTLHLVTSCSCYVLWRRLPDAVSDTIQWHFLWALVTLRASSSTCLLRWSLEPAYVADLTSKRVFTVAAAMVGGDGSTDRGGKFTAWMDAFDGDG